MGKILTVAIPSYNVEKYLHQTLDSFVDTTILEDVEVLIVDDGSKDHTADIGKEYEEKYPNTFRVISKENGGHGSTINCAIEEGCGRYFKVVDGDDWVNTKDFVALVHRLRQCNSDYVVTDYYKVDDNTGEKEVESYRVLERDGSWDFAEIADKVQIQMHALVIKMSILKEQHIRLDEHRFYVDVEYILFPVPYVQTVEYFPLCVYEYRLAQVTQSVSMQGYQKHMQNHIDVILHLADFLETYIDRDGEKEKVDYIGKRIAQMVGDQATIFMSFGANNSEMKKKFEAFDQELKEKSKTVYQLSQKESGMLRMLRRFQFRGYSAIVAFSKKRNRMEI